MLAKIKVYAMALLGAGMALFYVLFKREQHKRLQDEHEDVENAQRVERQDAKITTDGLVDESKTREEVKGKTITDYFRPTP